MFAAESTIPIPSWIERIALPEYPAMPILAYLLLGVGALLLTIGYFAPIKKIPSLFAAMALLAYYPLAYLLSWYVFRYDEDKRALREPTKFESFLLEHRQSFEWVILGLCAFFGLLFLVWTVWATLRKGRRKPIEETVSEDNPFAPQPALPPQAAAARPAVPRPPAPPQAPAVRKVPKKAPPPGGDNPFNFQ